VDPTKQPTAADVEELMARLVAEEKVEELEDLIDVWMMLWPEGGCN
jgi:hypothetical protein